LTSRTPVLFRQKGVGPLIDFPLDEAAAAGDGLEISRDALILGAPLPELAHGFYVGSGPRRDAAEIGQRAFDVGRQRLPGQLAQF
jgi:hypothetical protein